MKKSMFCFIHILKSISEPVLFYFCESKVVESVLLQEYFQNTSTHTFTDVQNKISFFCSYVLMLLLAVGEKVLLATPPQKKLHTQFVPV